MNTSILIPQIKGVIENKVFTSISGLGTGVSDSTLRAVISRVAELAAVYAVETVGTSASSNINTIPQNLIGVNNPVNLVSGNLGSTGVSNNITGTIDTQVNAQITNKIVTLLEQELRGVLPASGTPINFPAIAATLTQLITPTVSSTIGTITKSFTDALFGTGITTPPVLTGAGTGSLGGVFNNLVSTPFSVDGIDDLFGDVSSSLEGTLFREAQQFQILDNLDNALEKIDTQYTTTIANKYLGEAEKFDVNNAENQEKLIVLERGFTDPDAVYPTKEYAGKSETNLLAQGDARGTVVLEKNKNRMKEAKLPGGTSWSQPESPYQAEYPYNKVTQTESGHIIEIDDTPGAERLHVYHKSGTFIEIDSNGSVVKRAAGSSYEIIDKNGKIAIAGRADISINGECNIYVGNDANIEVDGDTNIVCHNDITAQAGGTINLSAREEINITSANVHIEAYNEMHLHSNVKLAAHVDDSFHLLSNANVFVQTTDLFQNTTTTYNEAINLHEKVAESIHRQADNIYNLAGSDIFSAAGGAQHMSASGDINLDGSEVHLNSGNALGSEEADASKPAELAKISNIGVMSGRKDIVPIELTDPTPLTLSDGIALELETPQPKGSKLPQLHRDRAITSGVTTAESYDGQPVVQDSTSVRSIQSKQIPGSQDILKATELPGNYNLSPNFTLEMVSSKAAVSKYKLAPDPAENQTFGQLAYNLQQVALNILEPVYNLYPNAFVTSGYRPDRESKKSQHRLGQAVDIQFRGASKKDYYEIAKKLAQVLNYDQLLLEYSSTTTNPWIHISYSGNNNKKQVLTFWNHRTHSQGLSQLA